MRFTLNNHNDGRTSSILDGCRIGVALIGTRAKRL